MTCTSCGKACREGARFCSGCGAALLPRCPACGAECEAEARFCDACGAPLAAAAAPAVDAGARKVVSIIFADLVGSTALHERLDAESARRLMERYYAALRATIESHGGAVVKLLGDGVMAAFGVRQVREDDALRAVRAAVAMQDAFRALVREQTALAGTLGLRIAVNTGEVVVSGAHDDLIGDPVNVAARLQEKGRDGDVVVGEATSRLVETRVTLEPLGELTLKGRAERVGAFRVASLDAPAGAAATPFVGRAAELARLDAVYDAAVAAPAARLAVLIGSPGLGKSRLIDEFARRHGGGATLLAAHCVAAGGASFAPLASALRAHLGIEDAAGPDAVRAAVERALRGDEADRARIAGGLTALLSGAPAAAEETFFVVRRFLAALAATRPVLLVIDDLHWAEPLLLDLVEHLVQWGAGLPLFVLVGARPELHGLRASLCSAGGVVADAVTLSGLDAGAAMRLAANVIGAADLPAAAAARVLATSEGNPLFVGELVRMLVQEGALTREGDRWIVGANLAELEMPPTIHALLAARIERLRSDERQVLERAAVVGRHFSRGAVAALLDGDGEALDERLDALRRGELIEPDSGWLLGEPLLRFHHVLIRDAAYRRLLKGTRAALHARLAEWIEAQVGGAPEHDETIGWHLEQAHQLLGDLGPLDAAGAALGARAAIRLAAAGRRALAGDDVALAAGLLGRAIACRPPDDPTRAELALDWCEALLTAGDVAQASAAIDQLGRFAAFLPLKKGGEEGFVEQIPLDPPFSKGEAERLRAWHTCFAGQLTVLTEPAALQATTESLAAAAAELTALGDAAGEAKAHSVHAQALARLGKMGACEAALDRALAAARRAGDRRRANAVLAGAPVAALWGPSPVTRASGRCLDVVRVLRITQGAPAVEAVALSCQAVLEALRGRIDAARRMLAAARQMVAELGIAHRLHETDAFAGRVAAMEGDAAAAEPLLRGAYDGLRELGLGIDAARAGALLARVLLAQGRAADAEALSHESEALAGDDIQAAIAWRGVRAEALAQRGEHAAAIELAQAAVSIAAATDALLDHADARLALAAALRAAGRDADADAELRRAVELWDAKGATLLAERVRRDVRSDAARDADAPPRPPAPPAAGRRVRPNAALRNAERWLAAIQAGDETALHATNAAELVTVHHPTGATYGAEDAARTFRALARGRNPRVTQAPLATLGDALVLVRRSDAQDGCDARLGSIGAVEGTYLVVIEVDQHERVTRAEIFADDRLGDALARLYQRHAERLPDGPRRQAAAVTAEAVAHLLTSWVAPDLTRIFTPDYADIDHRNVGYAMLSPAELPQLARSFQDLAENLRFHLDDVFALGMDGLVRQTTASGTWRDGGGAFERPVCCVTMFGADGRVTRHETFDGDRAAEALARFDALRATAGGGQREAESADQPLLAAAPAAVPPDAAGAFRAQAPGTDAPDSASPFANPASRSLDRAMRAWAAGDRDDLQRFLSPALRVQDRRRLPHVGLGIEQVTAQLRGLFATPRDWSSAPPIATRGDRLSLHRVRCAAEASGGAAGGIDDALLLVEVDATGRWSALALFDGADEAAAWTEIEGRFDAGEGAAFPGHAAVMRTFAAAVAKRDWDLLVGRCAPAFVEYDHRPLAVLGTTHGAAAWVQNFRALTDLAPDTTYRVDHFRSRRHGFCTAGTWIGTRDGGRYEIPLTAVIELDAEDRMVRADGYDREQTAQALARFAELDGAAAPAHPFANAAAAVTQPLLARLIARDWRGVSRLLADDFTIADRRRAVQRELDRDQYVESFRGGADGRLLRSRWELLATRGEQLALIRRFDECADAGDGRSEHACLSLQAVDARGRLVSCTRWDLDDLAAAYVELDARWQVGDAAAHARAARFVSDYARCFAARDWDRLRSLFSAELVAHNYRLAGWGNVGGPAAMVQTMQAQVELAPDTEMRMNHVRVCAAGALFAYSWRGTHDGGEFENLYLVAAEFDRHGRVCRVDVWESEQLAQAQARFAELARGDDPALPTPVATAPRAPRRDPLRIPPNAVTALLDRWSACGRARDWDGLARLYAPAAIFDDRRRLVRLRGDRSQAIASARHILESGRVDFERTALATAGDRLGLDRWVWRGGRAGADFVVETLTVTEVDADGLGVAWITFDAEDRAAANAELIERYARGGGALVPAATEYLRVVNARDSAHLRALLPDDFVFHDHRRTGIGRVEGAAHYLEALRAVWELSPDARLELLYEIEIGPHGRWGVGRTVGSNREGGEFESVYVSIAHVSAGRLAAVELFEPDDLDAARARFAALRAAAPPAAAVTAEHAAMASIDRWRLGAAHGGADWEAMRASLAATLVFEDRQGFARLRGDREMLIASLRERVASGARPTAQLVGTAGAHVAIVRMLWSGGPADGRFEIEYLAVTEADADGLVVACILFAADDTRGAQREAWARWAAADPAAGVMTALFGAVVEAANAHDLSRYRALFADHVVVEDRRHGLRMEGLDDYAEQVALLWQHAPDARIDGGWSWPALAPHGAVTIARRTGALADEFVWLFTVEDGRIDRIDVFGLDAIDAARARLAELRPD